MRITEQSITDAILARRHSLETAHVYRGHDDTLVGEVTPEYYAKIKAAGGKIAVSDILTEKGNPTGHKQRRVRSPFDTLYSRRYLTDEQYTAGNNLLAWYYFSGVDPRITQKYDFRGDKEHSELDPVDRRRYYAQKFYYAYMSVDYMFQFAAKWLLNNLSSHPPIHIVGAYYSPDKAESTQSAIGRMAVSFMLCQLCDYMGIEHHLSKRMIYDDFDNQVKIPQLSQYVNEF